DGFRPQNWVAVSFPRDRLRGVVLPQGRPGAHPHRRAEAAGLFAAQSGRERESAAETVTAQARRGTFRQRSELAQFRDLWTRVQAAHRRYARGPVTGGD